MEILMFVAFHKHTVKLLPNTIDGLRWGLSNFDGVEFDIRLTSDSKLVIHHNAVTDDGDIIRNTTQMELKERGLPTIEEFFRDEKIRSLIKEGRELFIELKPDCDGKNLVVEELGSRFRTEFDSVFTDLPMDGINFLSFQTTLLDSFADTYKCFPILPAVNECKTYNSDFMMLLSYLPKVIGKSLKKHIVESKKKGYAGVFFARQYLFGPTKIFHPKYSELVELSKDLNMAIGTNLGNFVLEADYTDLYRFSDQGEVYPRHCKSGEGKIIAHRGTGTKGVNVRV